MKHEKLVFSLALVAFCAAASAQSASEFASAPMRFHTEDLNASAPDLPARQERARACGDEFHEKFAALVAESTSLSWAMDRASQINEQYDQCVQRFGLTGYAEFLVGGSSMRTHAFLRAWDQAAAQERQQQVPVPTAAAVPPIVFPMPADSSYGAPIVTCRSIRSGINTTTTCR